MNEHTRDREAEASSFPPSPLTDIRRPAEWAA